MFATFQRLYEHCKQNNVLERRETFPVFFVANAPSNAKNKRTCCFFNDTLIFLGRIPFVVTSKTLHRARFGWKKGNFCVNDTTTVALGALETARTQPKRRETFPVFFATNAASRIQPKRQENLSFRREKYAGKTFRKDENKAKVLLVLP